MWNCTLHYTTEYSLLRTETPSKTHFIPTSTLNKAATSKPESINFSSMLILYSQAVAALQCSSWSKPRTQSFWGWRRSHSSFLSQFRRLSASVFLFSVTRATNTRRKPMTDADHWFILVKPLAQGLFSQHRAAHSCLHVKDRKNTITIFFLTEYWQISHYSQAKPSYLDIVFWGQAIVDLD